MLALIDTTSQPALGPGLTIAQVLMLAVGGLLALIWAVQLGRSGRWRQPLADIRPSGTPIEPTYLLRVFLVPAVYVVSASILSAALPGAGAPAERGVVGSSAWHVVASADAMAKLIACVLIVLLLRDHRSFAPPGADAVMRFPVGTGRLAAVALAATLIIIAVTTLQLSMGQTIWHWLAPDAAQPTHQALVALRETQWGWIGRVQLAVTAVVVAPIAEELFFRGLLFQLIHRLSGQAWLTIAVTGIAFGAIHYTQPQDVVPLATMGLALGYLRARYRSIELCILTHALFNGRTILFALLSYA